VQPGIRTKASMLVPRFDAGGGHTVLLNTKVDVQNKKQATSTCDESSYSTKATP